MTAIKLKLEALFPGLSHAAYDGLQSAFDKRRHQTRPLNVVPDENDLRDRHYQPSLIEIQPFIDIPDIYKSIDDRRLERRRRRSVIRDQGEEGSCTGQALASIIDLQLLRRRFGRPTGEFDEIANNQDYKSWLEERVSSRMLYEMARTFEFAPNSQLQGSSLRNVLKGFYQNGVCWESKSEYEPFDSGWSLTFDRAKNAKKTSLGAYYRLNHNTYDYHTAINETGSLLVSAMVHEGWNNDKVALSDVDSRNVKRINYAANSKLLGAHAFAIVGYSAEGFYVLNSWGSNWGLNEDQGTPGIALWSYEDWRRHVLDAWVIRLASSSASANIGIGGFGRGVDPLSGKILSNTPRLRITGHYLNLTGDRFVRRGRYPNDVSIFSESAKVMLNPDRRADQLALVFASGLQHLRTCSRKVEGLLNLYEEQGTYPVCVFWNYAEESHLKNIIGANYETLVVRHGADDSAMHLRLERELSDFGDLFWNRMEKQIASATGSINKPIVQALRPLIETAVSNDLKIQLVCHSDGVLMLEAFLECVRSDSKLYEGIANHTSAIRLVAPICLSPANSTKPIPRIHEVRNGNPIDVITNSQTLEDLDTVGTYKGSYPRLIQNVFYPQYNIEGAEKEGILGLCRTASLLQRKRSLKIWQAPSPPVGRSSSHFDMLWNPSVARALVESNNLSNSSLESAS